MSEMQKMKNEDCIQILHPSSFDCGFNLQECLY